MITNVPIHVAEDELKLLVFCHLLAEFNTDMSAHGIASYPFTITDFALCNKFGAEDLTKFSNHWYKESDPRSRNTMTGKSQMKTNPPPLVLLAKVSCPK
jgi:hypothetical protein